MLTLITWLRWCLPDFTTLIMQFSPFHILLLHVSLSPAPTQETGTSSTSWRRRVTDGLFYVSVRSVFTPEAAHRSTMSVSVWLIETLWAFKPWVNHIFDFFTLGNIPHKIMPTLTWYLIESQVKSTTHSLFTPIRKGSLLSLTSQSLLCSI